MSEIEKIELSENLRTKLVSISKKFGKLNTGSTSNEFWLGMSTSGGYSWEQLDIGINKAGELITCTQSGCSCYGPEHPAADQTYPLDEPITLEHEKGGWDDYDLQEAVNEVIEQADVLYKVLNDEGVSAEEILGLPNAEIRRAVVELVGYDKIIGRAELLDESDDGRLLRIKQANDEDIVLVHVKDPSTDREYFLRVPPATKTARAARAWTFGFDAKDFEPLIER